MRKETFKTRTNKSNEMIKGGEKWGLEGRKQRMRLRERRE
jgi:hypothetical protein